MVKYWWKRHKCGSCKKVFKKKDHVHVLKVKAEDGTIEMEICTNCANFWDASAEVLQRGRRDDDEIL